MRRSGQLAIRRCSRGGRRPGRRRLQRCRRTRPGPHSKAISAELSSWAGAGQANAEVIDSESRVAASADRGPATPVFVEPAAAAQHAVATVNLGVVDVPAPLPGVAQHVVQTPGVRLLTADGMRLLM